MSRSAAIRLFTENDIRHYLENRHIELLSGGLDEAPMAYKDIHTVMAAQTDLVDILARFDPKLVKMAPSAKRGKAWRKKKKKHRKQ